MNKAEFIDALKQKLAPLGQAEVDKSTAYYSELIADRIDDGMSEEEAVAALGNIDDIVKNIMLDAPLGSVIKAKRAGRRSLTPVESFLLIVSSPFWISILVVIISAILSVYISIWSVILSLWVAVAAIAFSGIVGMVASFFTMTANLYSGLFLLGCSLMLIGLTAPAFMLVKYLTLLLVKATKMFARFIKNIIIGKGVNSDENRA